MAASWEIDMTTRASALESFAQSFGACVPRRPIPEWWKAFEEWYTSRGMKGTQEDKDSCKFLRTEGFGYDDGPGLEETLKKYGIK